MKMVGLAGFAFALMIVLAGCQAGDHAGPSGPGEHEGNDILGISLVDVTESSGIDFVHFSGTSERRLLPETMGSGVAFCDLTGNGLPDLLFLNGASLTAEADQPSGARLFLNQGDGNFTDATEGSGLEFSGYAMGVAVGDFDNDGLEDLLITRVGRDLLFRNLGEGRFEDVTERVGLEVDGFSSSAAFLDYDRDGFLDLFIARYVKWSVEDDIPCRPDGLHQAYCTPEVYEGISNVLLKNHQGSRFEDVSEKAGVSEHAGKALGVVVFDYNQDLWPDIAVANDTVRNFLFVNQGNGTFSEMGTETGMAYSDSGAPRGGMGIDAADVDRDGHSDIVIGNFAQEMVALFKGSSHGYFADDAAVAGLGIPTLLTLAFGTLIEDIDNDGWLDVLVVNGHIEPEIASIQRSQSYAQVPQFFRNSEGPEFQLLTSGRSESVLNRALVGRGLASADMDLDGDLDFVITQNGGPAVLIRNDWQGSSWLQLKLEGSSSNRSAVGAKVTVYAGDESWSRELNPARSYLAACDSVLVFGLGDRTRVDRVQIQWPSGLEQNLDSVETGKRITVREPE